MLLAELVAVSERVGATSKRTEKTSLLAELLRRLDVAEVETAVSWLAGYPRQGKTGVGYASLHGARGGAAEQATLTIGEVDAAIDDVAGASGRGSAQRRQELLSRLFARSTAKEQSFLVRLLTGELRQGALEGVMLDAVARAAAVAADRVRRAVMLAGSLPAVTSVLMREGEAALARYDVQLFRPVQPMLANSAEDAEDALEQLGEAALEYKFDGARIQVHKADNEVRIYSRNLNDVSGAVPEVVEAVRAMPARELILDGEVLSFDSAGRPNPFQVTMRRFGRKLDVERMRAELPVRPVWFDLLYRDGGSAMDAPQAERFDDLKRLTTDLVPHLRTADPGEAAAFVQQAIDAGHEGAMAKSTAAPYAAGARGQAWLKIKRARTLDLVILAAEWGNGRREGWLSNLHLGAADVVTGGFAMLGKTFKGLTDEMLAWQTQEFLKIEVGRDRYTVYLEPKLVAEIAFNEIQVSPRYKSGLALRFARVKRYRPDKPASAADTFQTVQQMAGITSPPAHE